jgi:aminoglycoside 2'-N-acetyltransferase I
VIDPSRTRVSRLATQELSPEAVGEIRRLLVAAFAGTDEGDFTEADWQHSIGGIHVLLEIEGALVGHASVIERILEVDGLPVRAGYVEAVAVDPAHQRRGLGTALMQEVNADIAARFELGALGTGSIGFYERLGWQVWRGPTGVRTAAGLERTPDEDGYILVLPTPASPPLSLTAPISCAWRPGDSW